MKPENIHIKKADDLVIAISAAKNRKAEIEAEVARRIVKLKSEFEISVEVQDRIITQNENELMELMVGQKTALFGADFEAGQRVDLPCGGALIASVIKRAKRVRKVLEALKLAGMKHLIKTLESVDWAEVDKLDDGVLAQLGTKRVEIENFEYESC